MSTLLSNYEIYHDEIEEHVYFDVELANPITGDDMVEAVYDQSFNQQILTNSNRYKMTLSRLYVPGSEIPLFLGVPDTYSISLEYDGLVVQEFLDFGSATARPVRSINFLLETINAAFTTAFTTLKAAKPGMPTTIPPQIVFFNSTLQLMVYVEIAYNEDLAGAPTTMIWLNTPLYHLLGCLHSQFVNIPEASDGRGLLLLVPDLGYNRLLYRFPGGAFPAATDSLELPQTQGNALNSVSQLSGFVITSTAFNIRKELRNRDELIDSPNFQQGSYLEQSTIFDLAVDQPGSSLTDYYVYTPSLYRWIDIQSNEHLNRIQFQIYYKLTTGALIPVNIGVGKSLGIKFLFQTLPEYEDRKKLKAIAPAMTPQMQAQRIPKARSVFASQRGSL